MKVDGKLHTTLRKYIELLEDEELAKQVLSAEAYEKYKEVKEKYEKYKKKFKNIKPETIIAVLGLSEYLGLSK